MIEHLTPRAALDAFILEQIAQQPAERRALLYRAFAAETSVQSHKEICNALADELDAIEHRHRQLALDFKLKASA